MLEARSFVSEIESARKILQESGVVFKGEYRCRDLIFSPIGQNKSLNQELLRLRINEKNIWNEKDVIVAIKQTEQKTIGKNSVIPLRKEFDTESEAHKFIEENFQNDFKFDFEFTRTGWQYDLTGNQVDLEKVENIPDCYSIEIKSKTEAGLKDLAEMLNLTSIIHGSTADAMKKRLAQL